MSIFDAVLLIIAVVGMSCVLGVLILSITAMNRFTRKGKHRDGSDR